MKTHFEIQEHNKGVLTLTVEPGDYFESVRKSINQYARTATLPGFRPGKVPVGLIKSRFGEGLILEEFNKVVPQAINDYLEQNNIKYLSRPIQVNAEEMRFDVDEAKEYELKYEMALVPDIQINLKDLPAIQKYQIEVTEKDLEDEIRNYAFKAGTKEDVDRVADAENHYYVEFLLSSENRFEPDPNPENLPKLYRYLSVNSWFNAPLKARLVGKAVGEVTEAQLEEVFPDGPDFAAGVLKVDRETYDQHTSSPVFLKVEKVQLVKPAELTDELRGQLVQSPEPLDEAAFRQKVKAQMEQQLNNLAEYYAFKQLQTELVNRYSDMEIAYDIVEKVFYQDAKPKSQEDFQSFLTQLQQLRESVRYHVIQEKVKELVPEARLPYKEFHEDVKATLRRDFNLPEPDAHDHDHDHDHNHNHDHSHKPDLAEQILANFARQNPQQLEKQYQDYSVRRFYHTLLDSQVKVETPSISVKEFNLQMQIVTPDLTRLPL